MPRTPLHALNWSSEHEVYECSTRGQVVHRFQAGDDDAWQTWLDGVTSLAFHGRSGSLNVYQEQRSRGGSYWYAYHTDRDGIRKRYLGQTAQVTLARLEEIAQALASAPPSITRAASPAHHESERSLPLATKLTPPRLPRSLVARQRLLAVLDEALATPLTLISATAGWGKTTLLAAWAHQHQGHAAWLSLDELENSPSCFWELVIAALRCCGRYDSGLGETTLALLKSPQPPALSTAVTALLHELESQEAQTIPPARSAPSVPSAPRVPVVLVLDDYHLIEESAVHESLRFFLEHLPPHLHVILSSRVDPDLPLARLRARGALTEIRLDDLRFREEEAQHLLGHLLSPALSDDEVGQLTQRTEGWVAGLQLAALALQKRADRADRAAFLQAFTGGQRYLLDYVQEDILARLPTNMHDFLLQTAILSRLDAGVCQAVTAAPDRRTCQQMLERLERANLFLVPLDEERRWYRLHDLFREALLAALEQTQPDRAQTLHRRAASYFEAHGQRADAIIHRLAAADFQSAARLMEQAAEQFWERGETAMLAHWVLALPRSLVREHARLVLTVALYLLNTVTYAAAEQRARTHAEVRQLMARVETALGPRVLTAAGDESSGCNSAPHAAGDAAEEARLHRHLRVLRMYLEVLEAAARGEHERLGRMQPKIEEIQDALDRDEDEEAIWRLMPLSYTFVLHYTVRQEGALMLPRLLDAKRQVSQSGSHFAAIKVMQYLAIAAFDAGQLRLAYEESSAALQLIEQIAGYVVLKGYFEMVQVEALYQWNRLAEARNRLHTVLRDATMRQHLDVLGGSYFALLRVELASGNRSAAEEALRGLEDLVRHEGFGTYPGVLPSIRALWHLALGRVAEAAAWAADVVFHEGAWESSRYFEFRLVIRTYFAQHRWGEALELLERWSGHLDLSGNIGITIMLLAQLLVALHHTDHSSQAREVAARLFALTEPEGYLRMYLDEGEPMRQALLGLLPPRARARAHPPASPTAPGIADTSDAHAAYISTLVAAFERGQPNPETSLESRVSGSPVPALTLTRREQEVLRLLAEGASNQEIAQVLMIELSTVKKHVSNLLGKLGATNRTQAIAQARARALL